METHPRSTIVYTAQSPEACALSAADVDMARLIERVGEVSVDIEADGYLSLARAICDQQISLAAGRTIWGRFCVACGGEPTAASAVALSEDALRACGFSRSKASYQHDLAAHVVDGRLDFDEISMLPDAEVIERLMTVRGIGRWTAEMYLIFGLARPDVFSLADGGLCRAVERLKGLDAGAPKALIEALSEEWAPYRTCAALYLWRGLDV